MRLVRDETGNLPVRNALAGRIGRRITLFSLALTLLAAVSLSLLTLQLIEKRLTPELEKQSLTLAEFVSTDIARALRYGIPLEELRGVETYFQESIAPHPEIDFIALVTPDGTVLNYAGRTGEQPVSQAIRDALAATPSDPSSSFHAHSLQDSIVLAPIRIQGEVAALVAAGADAHFTERQLRELVMDVIVILVVAMFLSFEFSLAILNNLVTRPLSELTALFRRAAAGNLGAVAAGRVRGAFGDAVEHAHRVLKNLRSRYAVLQSKMQPWQAFDLGPRVTAFGERHGLAAGKKALVTAFTSPAQVRLALFILVGADEMQKAFLPLYVDELHAGVLSWLSQEVMVGLPISIYMLALALFTPFAGTWTDRYGAKRIFLVGLIPAFAGFVGSAYATTVLELIASRAMSAIGYSLCTIAAQGFILSQMPRAERAQGASIFISVIMAANICGTAIGGLLANLISYRAVFLCAAGLSILAALICWRMLPTTVAKLNAPKRGLRLADLRMMLGNGRFMAILLLAAIPAKVVLTGFLFYAVPISLSQLGASESEIGRSMILYSLVIILTGPWLSRMATTATRSWLLVGAGTLFSGGAILLLLYEQTALSVVGSIALVGLAHAMSISPQIALVPEICRRESELIGETGVLGIFRMLERIGSVAGPVLIAILVLRFGLYEGLAWMGIGVITTGLLLMVLAGVAGQEQEEAR